MNKQAFIKLATLRLAIDYVLRNRKMTKQALWPFSSSNKYKFQTDPNWENDPEAVNEYLGLLQDDINLSNSSNLMDRLSTKPALKLLKNKGRDYLYYLYNKQNSPMSSTTWYDEINSYIPEAYNIKMTPKEQQAAMEYITEVNNSYPEKVYEPEETKYYLNNGLAGLHYLVNENDDLSALPDSMYNETSDMAEKFDKVKSIYNKYFSKYNSLPKEDVAVLKRFIQAYRDRKKEYGNALDPQQDAMDYLYTYDGKRGLKSFIGQTDEVWNSLPEDFKNDRLKREYDLLQQMSQKYFPNK